MARETQLTIVAGRLAILVVAVVGAHAARGAGTDLSGFVGVWTFQARSNVQALALCPGASGSYPAGQELSGSRVSLYPDETMKTDLIFDIGCHCTLGLNVAGSRATLAETRSCVVMPKGEKLAGDITAVTLDLASDGGLTLAFSGVNGVLGTIGTATGCALSDLSGSGTLVRTGSGKITCGDEATAVGVLPYSPSFQGQANCPLGAGVEGLTISMHDEDQPGCSATTGDRGEGRWVLPDDLQRELPPCTTNHNTTLTFCRVDGALFKSMTTALAPEQSYAVLKLGGGTLDEGKCPNGSIEISKTIDNEDNPVGTDLSASLGDLGPNTVSSDPVVGTITKLVFCYFRGAGSADPVMTEFPDLGFPYAVFHAYAGQQPAWVMLKRWMYSDDEDSQRGVDHYDPEDDPSIPEFQNLIENSPSSTTYTFFNLARVR